MIAKLGREPIEDLRLDFEDGYGARPGEVEDTDAVRVAGDLAKAIGEGTALPSSAYGSNVWRSPPGAADCARSTCS